MGWQAKHLYRYESLFHITLARRPKRLTLFLGEIDYLYPPFFKQI